MKLLGGFFLVFCLLSASEDVRKDTYGATHDYQDWEVACDNTHHCEAAGYQAERSDGVEAEAAALFISRDAGPGSHVEAKVMLGIENPPKTAISLAAGKVRVTGVRVDQFMAQAQVETLLDAIKRESTIEISDGKRKWMVSLAGATAAMLKMDDLQGRVGTPGALVRKGVTAESNVPSPQPAPVVNTTPLPPQRNSDKALIEPVLAAVDAKNACEERDQDTKRDGGRAVLRVSASKILVADICWMGPYQSRSAVWLANDKPPYAPVKLRFPLADGGSQDEVISLELDERGQASSREKGRGLGDCGTVYEWAWTGEGFALAEESAADMCRNFPGGINLQLWRSQK